MFYVRPSSERDREAFQALVDKLEESNRVRSHTFFSGGNSSFLRFLGILQAGMAHLDDSNSRASSAFFMPPVAGARAVGIPSNRVLYRVVKTDIYLLQDIILILPSAVRPSSGRR